MPGGWGLVTDIFRFTQHSELARCLFSMQCKSARSHVDWHRRRLGGSSSLDTRTC